ncbi:hypothetical protein QG145_10895, partial [Kingella kingae]|nr:hypothetical protein [Kingella kingae]
RNILLVSAWCCPFGCLNFVHYTFNLKLVRSALCTSCTRRSLSPCPNLNLIHYNLIAFMVYSLLCK